MLQQPLKRWRQRQIQSFGYNITLIKVGVSYLAETACAILYMNCTIVYDLSMALFKAFHRNEHGASSLDHLSTLLNFPGDALSALALLISGCTLVVLGLVLDPMLCLIEFRTARARRRGAV